MSAFETVCDRFTRFCRLFSYRETYTHREHMVMLCSMRNPPNVRLYTVVTNTIGEYCGCNAGRYYAYDQHGTYYRIAA